MNFQTLFKKEYALVQSAFERHSIRSETVEWRLFFKNIKENNT